LVPYQKKKLLILENLPWLGKGTLTLIEGFDILKKSKTIPKGLNNFFKWKNNRPKGFLKTMNHPTLILTLPLF
jgi:hypothetical protein